MTDHPSSEDLAAWIDYRMPQWHRRRIWRHLRTCEPCRSLVAEIRQTLIAVRDEEKKAEAR